MSRRTLTAFLLAGLLIAGCGDNDVSGPGPGSVEIRVTPEADTIGTNESIQLQATVENTSDTFVSWTIEGVGYGDTLVGTVSPTGLYTAPARLPLFIAPLTVTVVAIPRAAPSKSDTAFITIEPADGDLIIELTPFLTDLSMSEVQLFEARLDNAEDPGVVWSLDDIPGVQDVGSIADGSYQAPDYVEDSLTVIVRATSVEDSTKSAVAFVRICTIIEVALQPTEVRVGLGQLVAFQAAVKFTADTRIAWFVNEFSGGNLTVGRMVSSDTYQAPSSMPDPAVVQVRAVSQKDTTKSAVCTIELAHPPTAEAEDKTTDHDRGGDRRIYKVYQGNASGGYAIEGLDKIQEWIQIRALFEHTGEYKVAFRHASYEGVETWVTVTDPVSEQEVARWLLPLNGGGCLG